VGFALPALNKQGAKKILHALADLNLSSITDEPVRSTPVTNIVLQGGDKFAVTLDPVDIANGGVATNKKNSSGRPVIHSWGVRENEVASDIFTPTADVEGRVRGTVRTA
jgi:hypothetical protein